MVITAAQYFSLPAAGNPFAASNMAAANFVQSHLNGAVIFQEPGTGFYMACLNPVASSESQDILEDPFFVSTDGGQQFRQLEGQRFASGSHGLNLWQVPAPQSSYPNAVKYSIKGSTQLFDRSEKPVKPVVFEYKVRSSTVPSESDLDSINFQHQNVYSGPGARLALNIEQKVYVHTASASIIVNPMAQHDMYYTSPLEQPFKIPLELVSAEEAASLLADAAFLTFLPASCRLLDVFSEHINYVVIVTNKRDGVIEAPHVFLCRSLRDSKIEEQAIQKVERFNDDRRGIERLSRTDCKFGEDWGFDYLRRSRGVSSFRFQRRDWKQETKDPSYGKGWVWYKIGEAVARM